VGDEGAQFFKRDIQKLSDEMINNFQTESPEIKESILKQFVEAYKKP